MNNEKYRELYIDLKNIKESINDLVSYNELVESELKDNFMIDDKIVESDRYVNYENRIKNVKKGLVSEIIPDVYGRL